MNTKFNKYSEEENRMYNGQTVMSVLSNLGNAATSDKISDEVAYMSNQRKEMVEPEVKRILRRGISNGFLVKFGKNYLLSGDHDDIVDVDSKRRSYKTIGKRNRTKRNIKSVERISGSDETGPLRVTRNIAFKLEETDSSDKNDELVLLNPKEVVNGIIHDLFNLVQTSAPNSEEEEEEKADIIDLEAILSKNLNTFSKPFDEVTEME